MNPLAEIESVYFGSDWDRAARRAANTGRANLDLIRILLLLSADVRRLRELIEQRNERAG